MAGAFQVIAIWVRYSMMSEIEREALNEDSTMCCQMKIDLENV